MKLFLASYIKDQKSISHLEKMVGGLRDKKIAYIPTAANGETGWGSWGRVGGSLEMVNNMKARVKIIQLEDYRNDTVVKEIEGNDIIWFAGGVPGYLMYWIKRCYLDKYLKEILNSGILYVGSSAGAMIAGQSIEAASWGFVDGERGSEEIKPLGLVDFDIFPHYEEKYLNDIKKNYQGKKLYLLRNGEEIVVDDSSIVVWGEERIIS